MDTSTYGVAVSVIGDDAKVLAASALLEKWGHWFLVGYESAPTFSTRTDLVPRDAAITGSLFLMAKPIRCRPQSGVDLVRVGRLNGNDVALVDESVSRYHAFFKDAPDGLFLQDAGSRNGTFVNDEPVPTLNAGPPRQVMAGSIVRLGAWAGVAVDVSGVLELANTAR